MFHVARLLVAVALTLAVAGHASAASTAAGMNIDVNLGDTTINKGSANILTTSKKVICSAFIADTNANPPVSMTTLTIAAKGKQKGD
jgi:hypothetical protein